MSRKWPWIAVGAAPCGRPPVLRWGMFPHHSVGEGLAPPAMSRKWPWIAVGAAPCGRPFSVNHDARRARRLGAPHLAGFRPAGRPPLPASAKEAKRRQGCPAVALWLQRGHPRTPGIYGGPILGVYRPLSGAGGTTTAPASAPLPLSVRNQDGLVCWTKQARLIAQVLISAAVNWRAGQETRPYKAISVGTVSLPRLVPTSRGRGCRSGCAGRIRPPRTVTPVGRDDSARRTLQGFARLSTATERFTATP